jgi:hypothetical protein
LNFCDLSVYAILRIITLFLTKEVMRRKLLSLPAGIIYLFLFLLLVTGALVAGAERVDMGEVAARHIDGQEEKSALDFSLVAVSLPEAAPATSTAPAGKTDLATSSPIVKPEVQPEPEIESAPEPKPRPVPFAVQAPIAEWQDARQQDGCEEAAALMVHAWANGYGLDAVSAKEKIIAISEYEQEHYGVFRDTSAKDTAERILKGYFGFTNWEIKENATLEDIKSAVAAYGLVIAPMNGQVLDNPYYTPPGPERHMIVVKGYDKEKREFITNDPGTKHGENFRYPENVFYAAIRDYSTGNEVPITGIDKTVIIVHNRF